MNRDKNMPVVYKLKDCCQIIAGQSPESKYYNTNGEGLPFFQGKTDFGVLYPKVRMYCSQPSKIAEKDDILLSVRAPVGPTNLSPGKVCIGRGLTAIRPGKEVCLKYLLYFFRYYEAQLQRSGTGTTFKAITQNVVKNIEVPVPSIEEQERIVSKIEELFSKLDASVAELQTAKEKLKVYRQAVLKEAFRNVGKKVFLKSLFCGTPQNGVYKPKSAYGKGTRILRIDGFYDGFVTSEYEYKRLSLSEEEIEKYSLNQFDLVINRVNSMPYLGKCALIRHIPETTVFESNIMRVRLNPDVVSPEYVTYFLASDEGKRELTKNAKQAVNQASINQMDVGNALIPIPGDIVLQEQIVSVIERYLSVCASIEQSIDISLQQAEALRQSILKQAFEGRLV